jgi:hypothetical protein
MADLIDNPVINSPFAEPRRHFRFAGESENFFLLLMQPPTQVATAQIPPREYLFVVDVSGSMHGFPLETSKQWLEDLLGHLRSSDRFNILLFAGGSSVLAEQSLPATPAHLASALQRAAIGPQFGYHPQQELWNMANLNPDNAKIQPNHFYSSRADKTKFNWFAFELACEIERAVPFRLKKRLAKNGYTQQTFNQSCIRLAVLLQGVALRKLSNEIPLMEISHAEVESAFPRLNDKIINQLLDGVANAWENLLCICVSCPCACVSNKEAYCPMFDDPSYYNS